MSSSLTFRVKGWLSDEEFRELLRIADYLGSDRGYRLFRLDPGKLRAEGLSLGDAVEILRGVRGVDPGDIEALERLAEELETVRLELGSDGHLYVASRAYLKDVLREAGFMLPYDRERRAYKALPMLYGDLVDLFSRRGFRIEDRVFPEHVHRLPRSLAFKGQLRDYQEEALRAWEERGRRGVIALPTGAGKTVVAIAAMARLNTWTLVVVYTRDHVKQWIDAIRRFTDAEGMVGAYYGEEKRLAPITVATYQTAYRRVRELARYFKLLIFDEAHHIPADKFKWIAQWSPAPYRMGLSATPEREDGRHEEIFRVVGPVVYHIEPGELSRRGYLAPYVIRRVKVELSGEERKRYEELRRRFQALARGRSFDELLAAARQGDESAVEALRIHAQMREIIQGSEAKLREVERIVREELAKGSKIIVFTQYKSQAEEIARRVGGLLLHGGLDRRLREAVLEKFRRLKSGVLVVTTVGDEGLDIPDANVGILVSGTGSRRQFIQRLGRLLRPAPGGDGKKAVLYEVIAAGTSEEFQSRKRRGLTML